MRSLVLDTNIVLDLLVFDDEGSRELMVALDGRHLDWLASAPMRDELERVLAYPQIVSRLAFYGLNAAGVLAEFDRRCRLVETAERSPLTCSDPDDQMFIDLAVRHRCLLLSKDAAVLAMRSRLLPLSVVVAASMPAPAYRRIDS